MQCKTTLLSLDTHRHWCFNIEIYEKIIKIFFEIHDPTTVNAQGPDIGTQYRSEIFFLNDNQKQIAEKVLKDLNERLSGKIVTKISILKNYCPAEEYHQKYLEKR